MGVSLELAYGERVARSTRNSGEQRARRTLSPATSRRMSTRSVRGEPDSRLTEDRLSSSGSSILRLRSACDDAWECAEPVVHMKIAKKTKEMVRKKRGCCGNG